MSRVIHGDEVSLFQYLFLKFQASPTHDQNHGSDLFPITEEHTVQLILIPLDQIHGMQMNKIQ